MTKTKKKTSRAAYWREHISQWSKSGLTQAEYCHRKKLSAAAFHWWKGELRRKSKAQKESPTSMQFVEVYGVLLHMLDVVRSMRSYYPRAGQSGLVVISIQIF